MIHLFCWKTFDFRFFRVCTEICADVSPQDDIKSRYHVYNQIDAFVRLVCLLIRHSGDAHNPGNPGPSGRDLKHEFSNKSEFIEQSSWYCYWYLYGSSKEFARLLSNAIPKNIHNVILRIVQSRSSSRINQLAYAHGIFKCISLPLPNERYFYSIRSRDSFFILAPGFVFSWLELIGYRTFVMRMMQHRKWLLLTFVVCSVRIR